MSSPTKAVFIYSPALDRFSYPQLCPFDSRRAGIVRQIAASMGLLTGRDREERAPRALEREIAEKFHKPEYLDLLQTVSVENFAAEALWMGLGTEECPVFDGLYDYASLASGGSVDGARLILSGEASSVFNPSGGFHHAAPERASGFCYINDVVLACMVLADAGKQVLFLDLDAHHGDGVQNAFFARNDVLTLSIHESGETLFPGSGFVPEIGEGAGRGYAVNVPLPAGTYDEAYLTAFREVVLPLTHAFSPDVFVLELGMDGLAGDPLTHLSLTNNAYAEALELIMAFGRPILATGGGGYNVENTTRGWALMWSILCGDAAASDMTLGLGGVMLASTEWAGGLRDRVLAPAAQQRRLVDSQVRQTIEAVRALVFPLHGI